MRKNTVFQWYIYKTIDYFPQLLLHCCFIVYCIFKTVAILEKGNDP